MSVRIIHLRKLLMLFYGAPSLVTKKLREDIRTDIARQLAPSGGGGDFHVPFWTDAKHHIAGRGDLHDLTRQRIESNRGKQRLYPLLEQGFLLWWNERRRLRNESVELNENPPHTRIDFDELNATVKVENLAQLRVGDNEQRLIYPYFSEEPTLPDEGGRVAIWMVNRAFGNYYISDIRILDVLRGAAFSTATHPLAGNEEDLFVSRYRRIIDQWNALREGY